MVANAEGDANGGRANRTIASMLRQKMKTQNQIQSIALRAQHDAGRLTIGGRKMKCSVYLLVCLFAFTVAASARMGETQEECQQRYGQSVTNYPGHGDLIGCEVYVKDGIAISVFFVKTTGKDSRARLVIYSRLRPDAQGVFIPPPEITSDEQRLFLGSVVGRWENYDIPTGLAGKPSKVIPLSTQPTLIVKQRDSARQTVQKVVETLYSPSLKVWTGNAPKDVAHISSQFFAFRVARGLAICSYDAIAPITAWADYVVSERENANKTPKNKLSGF